MSQCDSKIWQSHALFSLRLFSARFPLCYSRHHLLCLQRQKRCKDSVVNFVPISNNCWFIVKADVHAKAPRRLSLIPWWSHSFLLMCVQTHVCASGLRRYGTCAHGCTLMWRPEYNFHSSSLDAVHFSLCVFAIYGGGWWPSVTSPESRHLLFPAVDIKTIHKLISNLFFQRLLFSEQRICCLESTSHTFQKLAV